MATVNFLYRSTKDVSTLNLRFLHRVSPNYDISIGGKSKIEVSKEYWEKKHKLQRGKSIEVANKQEEVNKEINKLTNFILTEFNSLANEEDANKAWLTDVLYRYYNPKPKQKSLPTTLIEYIEHYKNSKRNEVTDSTLKKINVVKHKLERFQKYRKRIIYIKDVNLNFKSELENYMIHEGYAPNTIAREIKYIKTFCNHARKNGIEVSNQLSDIIARTVKVESIYLTPDEIQSIANLKNLNKRLDSVRDWFLISYYTGQRISDFLRFNKEMLRYEQGKPLLEFTQRKTDKLMTIPLSSECMAILNKRNGDFPDSISDQKYNTNIKKVCKKAGITQKVKGSKKVETEENSKIYRKQVGMYPKYELVTSHIGRRSFATNNYGKIPTSFLKYVTGHSTESMFLNYINKSNKDIALELSKYLG